MRAEYFTGVTYKGSYASADDCPSSAAIPILAFTGRSNSGKSSLLSSLCRHANLARTSKKAGKTRTLNYFSVPPSSSGGPGLYLVDLPGYGYAALSLTEREQIRHMVDEYLASVKNVKLLIIVLDARREPGPEENSIRAWCDMHAQPHVFALTKWDKLGNKERAAALKFWNAWGSPFVFVSNETGYGVEKLLYKVRNTVRRPDELPPDVISVSSDSGADFDDASEDDA
ncbi:MAG: ribosome biogenesis GTP-binding protein YihA/YsxC [Spirochaetia bacterium]|nr:ribosome biogenesis GTP-binding protein YihA/YsxC [Spirochaetia bacterium]